MNKKLQALALCGVLLMHSLPAEAGWIKRTWRRMSTADKLMTGVLSAACLLGIGLFAYEKINSTARYDEIDDLPKQSSRRNSVVQLSDSDEVAPAEEITQEDTKDPMPSSSKQVKKTTKSELITALLNGESKKIRKLLKNKADVNQADSNGKTSFMYAIQHYDRKTFGPIWNKRPDLAVRDDRGWNWTMYALEHNLPLRPFTAILTSKGATVDNIDNNGITPVMYASMDDNRSSYLTHLLNKDCAFNAQDTTGKTALHHALETQSNRAVETLFEYDLDINLADNELKTALMKAIMNGQYNYAQQMLNDFGDIAVQGADIHGNTALYYAIQLQRPNLVRAILQKYPAPKGINLDKEINLATELGGQIPAIITNYGLGGGSFDHSTK